MKYAFVWLLSMLIIALLCSSLTISNHQIEGLTSKNKKKTKKSKKVIYNEEDDDDENEDDDDDEVEAYSEMTKKPSLFKTVLSAVNDWWE